MELAALIWTVFVSHAYLQAYAIKREHSGIENIFFDPKQTVLASLLGSVRSASLDPGRR